jgi:hypothetical protein
MSLPLESYLQEKEEKQVGRQVLMKVGRSSGKQSSTTAERQTQPHSTCAQLQLSSV